MNHVHAIGNLTADPELSYTQEGTALCKFSVAINEGKDREGGDRPPTYLDIVAWDKLAENCAEYLRKGRKVAVFGSIRVEKWTTDDGSPRKAYRILARQVEFLTPRDGAAASEQPPSERSRPAPNLDDLPF